ncbi:MAG: hypothetical protein GTO02_10505, partial [Candidatus Dadabacteria bacterium]|nr:hypothetical protein [Candidatus Dadabacteria bacterium]
VNTFGGIKWAVKGKEYILDFGLDGIYGNTSTSYAYVPIEIMLPKLSTISSGATQIEAKIMVSYEIDGAATGEMQLYDYTGATAITATQTALANSTWTYKDTAFFDLTAYEGKAIRLGTKRIGGTGSDAVKIESASLLIKIS